MKLPQLCFQGCGIIGFGAVIAIAGGVYIWVAGIEQIETAVALIGGGTGFAWVGLAVWYFLTTAAFTTIANGATYPWPAPSIAVYCCIAGLALQTLVTLTVLITYSKILNPPKPKEPPMGDMGGDPYGMGMMPGMQGQPGGMPGHPGGMPGRGGMAGRGQGMPGRGGMAGRGGMQQAGGPQGGMMPRQ
eukprot:GHVL01016457.1.p1 GENE.GHVL01016457.1~~GHVL01016457.1.p1  ORF type:complete len:188 (-),score=29.60 GHVL01016457.1:247-810(-)